MPVPLPVLPFVFVLAAFVPAFAFVQVVFPFPAFAFVPLLAFSFVALVAVFVLKRPVAAYSVAALLSLVQQLEETDGLVRAVLGYFL